MVKFIKYFLNKIFYFLAHYINFNDLVITKLIALRNPAFLSKDFLIQKKIY